VYLSGHELVRDLRGTDRVRTGRNPHGRPAHFARLSGQGMLSCRHLSTGMRATQPTTSAWVNLAPYMQYPATPYYAQRTTRA
jgi:hypothetical protein